MSAILCRLASANSELDLSNSLRVIIMEPTMLNNRFCVIDGETVVCR